MFVAVDRTSKFAFVELHEKITTAVSREFLLRLIAAHPYEIHTVLTDNGIQFTTPGAGGSAVPLIKEAIANGERFRAQHSWTNGKVERINGTIKDATVKRSHDDKHDQLRQRLGDFVAPKTSAAGSRHSRPHTIRVHLCKARASQHERCTLNPLHQMPRPNTYDVVLETSWTEMSRMSRPR